jgi:membrane protease YdiL (CAAX protease family)
MPDRSWIATMFLDAVATILLSLAVLALIAGGFLACGAPLRGVFEGSLTLQDHRTLPFQSDDERRALIQQHRGQILSETYFESPVSMTFLRFAFFAPFAAGFGYLLRKERANLRRWFKPNGRDLVIGVLFGAATASFALAYTWGLTRLGVKLGGIKLPEELMGGALIVLGTVAAPIVEEMYFRGRLFEVIERAQGTRPAFWITTVLFVALHVLAQPWLIPPYVIVTLALAWQRIRTGALTASMATHATHNAISLGLAMLLSK